MTVCRRTLVITNTKTSTERHQILDDGETLWFADAYSTSLFTLNYNHLNEVTRVLNSYLPPLRPGLHFNKIGMFKLHLHHYITAEL